MLGWMDGHTKSVTSAPETHQETNITENNAHDDDVNEEEISLGCFVVQLTSIIHFSSVTSQITTSYLMTFTNRGDAVSALCHRINKDS